MSIALVTVLIAACAGCETLGFYAQAVGGQWRLLRARVPVAELLTDESVPADLRARVATAQNVLTFADEHLGLQSNGRYRHYVALDREAVVWNVFAAPELSLTARTWCYPFVGCAPYRGYFARVRADRYAAKLATDGLETWVGAVPAYSTLGWFDDPLLSTFIEWPDVSLARLLIHELAHSRVWVSGDVSFNESFASFVGRNGARAWVARVQGDARHPPPEPTAQPAGLGFYGYARAVRARLADVYAMPVADPVKRQNKYALLDRALGCYEQYRQQLGRGQYDAMMRQTFNNAYLVSLATYDDYQSAFAALFDSVAGDWALFFAGVSELAEAPEAERHRRLLALQVPAPENPAAQAVVSCLDVPAGSTQ